MQEARSWAGPLFSLVCSIGKCLVSTYCHPHSSDTKVKENLSLVFERLLSAMGDMENLNKMQKKVTFGLILGESVEFISLH